MRLSGLGSNKPKRTPNNYTDLGKSLNYPHATMTTERKVTSFRLSKLATRQLATLTAQLGMNNSEIVSIAIDRLHQQETHTMTTQPRNITQTWLQSWIDTHRPDLGLLETNGVKGFYKLDAGPAHSFMGIGATWKQVAAHLEAIEVPAVE